MEIIPSSKKMQGNAMKGKRDTAGEDKAQQDWVPGWDRLGNGFSPLRWEKLVKYHAGKDLRESENKLENNMIVPHLLMHF